jgi:pyrroloquinoline quinone biosynthesis protein B
MHILALPVDVPEEARIQIKCQCMGMPRMKTFIEQNPWSQYQQNISLQKLEEQRTVQLSSNLRVTPFLVPHRDEFSETVGFLIEGPHKKALFIPDIDKWEKWNVSIMDQIAAVDYAFIDGTFYDAEEINYRNISEIPHPFITETMALFNPYPRRKTKNDLYT